MANSLSQHSVEDLAKALKAARERGQQVVPIVGAGLSADCGFPVITAVVRYFGMLYSYIELRGPSYYYNKPNNSTAAIFDERFKQYQAAPWKFLENFGWPDLFQLNEDLLTKLKDGNNGEVVKDGNDHAVREALDSLVRQFNQTGLYQYDELHKGISSTLSGLKRGKLFTNSKQLTAIGESRDLINSRFKTNGPKSAKFDVIGDWRRLILYFTNYRSDYADALFARFGATRKPGQGHRFLTFLAKVLAIRTILTFNFDSLIEEALELEGIRAKVFGMERGAGLPHQNLLRDQLSVIKAHGSTHALLLDEQLDRPLTKEYLERFDRITGENPFLLVMGCSSEDRRLRDLVSHVLEHGDGFSVGWLHYESWRPSFLEDMPKESTDKALILPTNNPGATLLHLYSWLTGSNPASRVPYLAHVQQPIDLAVYKEGGGSNGTASETTDRQFDWIAVTGRKFLTASQILLKRANDWARKGYQVIWIDLESLHTFAGVIGSIIDQCRKFDPDLAPSLLPVDVDKIEANVSGEDVFSEKALNPALERVRRALRRARYYLAIDGLGTYAWPATTHHGLTHRTTTVEAQRRVDRMVEFLETLEKKDFGESRIGVGLDKLGPRYRGMKLPNPDCFKRLFEKARQQRMEERQQGKKPDDNRAFKFDNHFSQLRSDLRLFSLKRIPPKLKKILSTGPTAPTGSIQERTLKYRARVATMLFSLACFRRTRPLVATNRLLEPLLGEELARDRLQEILKEVTESGRIGILQQLEGGSYWFNHSIRDQIYEKNTDCTGTASMRKCLTVRARGQRNRQHRRNAVFQLFLGAITHQRISQIWYNDTFVQSRDTFAFLEYTYHRISSIRNVVKLRALARVGANDKIAGSKVIAEDLVRGITKCAELICLLNEKDAPFKQLLFGDDGPFLGVLRNHSEVNSANRDWRQEAKRIQESLKVRHRRQLHGLYRGWTRAEVTLRTQVPAEQLLHWCDELLSDDLVQRCNRLVIKYRKKGEWRFEPEYYNFVDNKPGEKPDLIDPELDNENGDLKEFRRFLQDLQVKLWIERSDYESCITHRRRHLWHSLGEEKQVELTKKDQTLTQIKEKGPISEEIECSQDLVNECGIRQCHQLLNIANGKLKLQQEITSDENGLRAEANKVLVLLKSIEKRLKKLDENLPVDPSPETNEHHEAWLRLYHLQTEAQLAHVSMFSHDGFTGNPQLWKPKATNVVTARKTITKALEEVGGRDVHTRAAPRSVILHPTTDAAVYLQYRSLFNMFNGRIEWLRDRENIEDALKRALRSFELARGGLDTDTLLCALIEIYWTEALLAQGRFVLFDNRTGGGFHKAQEAYDSARGALRRARESLLGSHRYLMWRKFFFRIATQYHADRLLLRYAQMQERAIIIRDPSRRKATRGQLTEQALTAGDPAKNKQYFEENAREALLRLRRAYQTLVSALDLYLPLSAQNGSAHSRRYRWLYRMWWELTLCGYASGRVVVAALGGKDDSQAHDYVIEQLRWLNKADGVDNSALEDVFAKHSHCLENEYKRSLKGRRRPSALMTALTRRRNLIKQANELSEEWVELRKPKRL